MRRWITYGLGLGLAALLFAGVALSQAGYGDRDFSSDPLDGEFHFIRLEYKDSSWSSYRRRPWWMQDWPEAETHFAEGIRRLTGIDIGTNRHVPLTDDRIFEYPWAYATQVGYWDLSDEECARLREYLLRGGFLFVDDFHGPQEWAVFQESMGRTLPEYQIVDLPESDPLLHTLYDLNQGTQIPGLRHLRRGPNGSTVAEMPYPATWRGIYDEEQRLLVAVNFNMDIGDAWEHADWAEYPEPMTALAYRFGINYIIYAMSH